MSNIYNLFLYLKAIISSTSKLGWMRISLLVEKDPITIRLATVRILIPTHTTIHTTTHTTTHTHITAHTATHTQNCTHTQLHTHTHTHTTIHTQLYTYAQELVNDSDK